MGGTEIPENFLYICSDKIYLMKKITKIMLVTALLFGTGFSSLADRGIGKKTKNKVNLNITTSSTLRSSLYFNLRNGLKYTGSLLSKPQPDFNSSDFFNTLITFQKGNTVYIIPYKQFVAVPDLKSGYAGMKLIIRPH